MVGAIGAIVGILAVGLVGCGSAPGDGAEDTATSGSALLTPIKGPGLPPPWVTHASGIQAEWVDANGDSISSLTLYYDRLSGYTKYSGAMNVAIWDDLDSSGDTQDCTYALFIQTVTSGGGPWNYYSDTKGPLLCNGTPFFTTAPANALPMHASVDMLVEAFEETLGDTLTDVCEATNQRGVTVATPMYVTVGASGLNPTTGLYSTTLLAQAQPVSVNVTLMCET
jgi:hypothetical protein